MLEEPAPGSLRDAGEQLARVGVRGDSEGAGEDNPFALSCVMESHLQRNTECCIPATLRGDGEEKEMSAVEPGPWVW